MDPIIIYIIIGVAALIVGAILGKLLFSKNTKKQVEEAQIMADKIIADGQLQAETLKKEKLLEAKEKFVQLKLDHERDVNVPKSLMNLKTVPSKRNRALTRKRETWKNN